VKPSAITGFKVFGCCYECWSPFFLTKCKDRLYWALIHSLSIFGSGEKNFI